MMYLLADGIYPEWPIFAKPIQPSAEEDEKRYSGKQEAVRKDVERFFGCIQSRFEVLRRENRKWDLDDIITITQCCVILHNIIVRMHQNVEFRTEMGEVDAVSEFFETDRESARVSVEEIAENRLTAENAIAPNWEEEMERFYMHKALITDADCHFKLLDELIELSSREP